MHITCMYWSEVNRCEFASIASFVSINTETLQKAFTYTLSEHVLTSTILSF